MSLIFGIDTAQKRRRKADRNAGLPESDSVMADYTNIAKTQNWETMSMSTAQVGALVNGGYADVVFDGRYVYFVPYVSDTFIRFDTSLLFTNSSAWDKISMSTAQGAAALDSAYVGGVFDGRYIYYVPVNSDTFVRFDTTQGFTTVAAWDKIAMTTAQGAAALDNAYCFVSFDGRYVYFVPYNSDTFLRFDSTLAFTNAAAWDKISMSTAQGSGLVDAAYCGASFDGRYIYYAPTNSDFFIRFDTTLAFANSSAWSVISMSTAQGAATLDTAYIGNIFDGRYVYFVPYYSDSFIRFDTTKVFTLATSWENINMSTAQGSATLDGAYVGNTFDGRYVYYTPTNSDFFIRFDTTLAFTNLSAWSQISMSTAQGAEALDVAYYRSVFDGKYVYFAPFNSDTFLRVLANPSRKPYR